MSEFSINFLQKAIYETLSNSVEINNFSNNIYNYVPQNSAFPYIVIDIQNIRDISSKTDNIYEIDFFIHIFSKAKTSKSLIDVSEHIINLLIHHNMLHIVFRNNKYIRKEDGLTTKSELNFSVILSH